MVSPTDFIQHYNTGLAQSGSAQSEAAQSGSAPSAQIHPRQYYQCQRDVNIYDSPQLKALATQAATTRQLRILSLPTPDQTHPNAANRSSPALPVCLYEDDYPGWLASSDLAYLQPVPQPHLVPQLQAQEISDRIPAIIAYMKQAMAQPNEYRWGGTLGPNYDCSGLMQAAFRSVGIWLPRDAYQQDAFTQTVVLGQLNLSGQPNPLEQLEIGDLIFFGPKERANHVALYLGDRHYIHSSGRDIGRNGIGIDALFENGDPVSESYLHQIHGVGRVVASYQPMGCS